MPGVPRSPGLTGPIPVDPGPPVAPEAAESVGVILVGTVWHVVVGPVPGRPEKLDGVVAVGEFVEALGV